MRSYYQIAQVEEFDLQPLPLERLRDPGNLAEQIDLVERLLAEFIAREYRTQKF